MSDISKAVFELTPDILRVLKKCDSDIKSENLNLNSLEDVWDYLKKEEQEIDAKLNICKSKEIDLQEHMEQLHKYNDMKDIAQEILGRLANCLNISVVEAHSRFDLNNL